MIGEHRRAIRQSDPPLAELVGPADNIRQAIAIEVAHLHVHPAHPRRPHSWARPAMSALPSPLKSPTTTLSHLTDVLQAVHSLTLKSEPVDRPSHHWPVSRARPAMSVTPSPLKSPVTTSSQETEVL